jgi:DNA-binding PadR family transcriptional regulator
MSTTRLLVLGVVRMFQPVHGYFVRRELLSWRADQWAAINPGSIYGALKSLTKEAFLEEIPGGKGDKTRYRLTSDGEGELHALLREALWQVRTFHPDALMAGLALMWMIPRDEAIEILDGRLAQLRAQRAQTARLAESEGMPGMSREMFRFNVALIDGEIGWLEGFAQRVRDGEYAFAGEEALEEEQRRLMAEHAAEARAARGDPG